MHNFASVARDRRNWQREIMGNAKPAFIDKDHGYHSETASVFSFFFQFPNIICRWNGSVLPFIIIEVLVSTGLGVVASFFLSEKEKISATGHQLVGVLLAFLVVFRSQIAWQMYLNGWTTLTSIRTSAVSLANVAMSPMLARCRLDKSGKLPEEAHELVRLLKLFYFLIAEHLRSTEGTGAWEWSQHIAFSFALPSEIRELLEEYGPSQEHDRVDVRWKEGEAHAVKQPYAARIAQSSGWLARRKTAGEKNMRAALDEDPRGTSELLQQASAWLPPSASAQFGGGGGIYRTSPDPYDPTRGKVLKALLWLNVVRQHGHTALLAAARLGCYTAYSELVSWVWAALAIREERPQKPAARCGDAARPARRC